MRRYLKYFLVPFAVGCVVGANAQGSTPAAADAATVPTYLGDLHVIAVMKQRDTRTPEELEADFKKATASVEKAWRAQQMPEDKLKKDLANLEAEMRTQASLQTKNLELWAKGNKWVLTETDPGAKADVFAGNAPGKVVWVCDGVNLLMIDQDGFRCILFKPGVQIDGIPKLPALGISYHAMPLAIPPNIPAEFLSKVKNEPGWIFADVPSYQRDTQVMIPGSTYSDPTRFTRLNPGFVRMSPVGPGDGTVAEIRVGTVVHPSERWLFDDVRRVGNLKVAFGCAWNDFRPDEHGRLTSTPLIERSFSIESIDTKGLDDGLFSRDRYLKEGANVLENAEPGARPIFYRYQKGKSWAQMAAQ